VLPLLAQIVQIVHTYITDYSVHTSSESPVVYMAEPDSVGGLGEGPGPLSALAEEEEEEESSSNKKENFDIFQVATFSFWSVLKIGRNRYVSQIFLGI
jgi:hypothetical protein